VSVSSKQSRGSVGPSPMTPTMQSPLGTSGNGVGIHRSNTVPSKRSPGLPSGRMQHRASEAPVPGTVADPEKQATQSQHATPEVVSASFGEQTTPPAPGLTVQMPSAFAGNDSNTQLGADPRTEAVAIPPQSDRGLLVPGGSGTTTLGVKSTLKDFLSGKSPPSDGRKPNKLQKKRVPGSQNPSANSSSQSLEVPTGADQLSIGASTASNAPLLSPGRDQLLHPGPQPGTPTKQPPAQAAAGAAGELKPNTSPTASFRSHSTATEPEGLDQLADAPMQPSVIAAGAAAAAAADREIGDAEPTTQKKRYWFTRNKDDRSGSQTQIQPPTMLGQNDPAQRSRSSVISGGGGDAGAAAARRSMTVDRSGTTSTLGSGGAEAPSVSAGPSTTGEENDEKRGDRNPITWIKGKVRERAEKKEERDRLRGEEKRAKSPTPGSGKQGSVQNLAEGLNPPPPIGGASGLVSGRSSGRSVDLTRGSGKSMDGQKGGGAASGGGGGGGGSGATTTATTSTQQEKPGVENGAKEK